MRRTFIQMIGKRKVKRSDCRAGFDEMKKKSNLEKLDQ